MNLLSVTNRHFIDNHKSVIHHHVDIILKSRLLLDEDMQLITTFWNPSTFDDCSASISNWTYPCAIISCSCAATVGYMAYDKFVFNHFHPASIAILPAVIITYGKLKRLYQNNKYKKEFENLAHTFAQLFEVNRKISDYFYRRDVVLNTAGTSKLDEMCYKLLSKPTEDFLKDACEILISCLEGLQFGMIRIADTVPIMEGEFVFNLREVNLNDYRQTVNEEDLSLLKIKYRKLSDLLVLFVSNFLCSISLSFCIKLWKDKACQFDTIFNAIIPEVANIFKPTAKEIIAGFDRVRFTLQDDSTNQDLRKNVSQGSRISRVTIKINKPLNDLLTTMQMNFETAKAMQILINDLSTDESSNDESLTHLTPMINTLNEQLRASKNLLDTLTKSVYLITKSKNESAKFEIKSLQPKNSTAANGTMVTVLSMRHDDQPELGEDEEYNLSIHGSDDEDGEADSMFINEYVDSCPVEYLELMLLELKKKLNERRSGKKISTDKRDDHLSRSPPIDTPLPLPLPTSIPLPPPPPSGAPLPPPRPSLSKRSLRSEQSANIVATSIESPAVFALPQDFLKEIRSAASRSINVGGEEFQFAFNMYPDLPRPFNTSYSCYSVAMLPGNERSDVERGGKIIMPPSALEQLTRLNINYPMLFKITNKKTSRISHCGVLEFVADEGKVYLPLWMMQNLVLEEGDQIQIESVSLSVGNFAKFQPLSTDFLDITNPKAVLENCLRTFACLTSGDVIAVTYNQKVYELCVLETKPGNAISIIECDMNVEFAAPVGWKEHEPPKQQDEDIVVDPADLMPQTAGFIAFRGTGNRLDGKPRKDSGTYDQITPKPTYVRGIPDYDYTVGTITFQRHSIKSADNNKEQEDEFKVFGGEGYKLRRN